MNKVAGYLKISGLEPSVKNEFHNYVKEILKNIKKHHPPAKDFDPNNKAHVKNLMDFVQKTMGMLSWDNPPNEYRKFFPNKYDKKLIDDHWHTGLDIRQQRAIVVRGLSR